ncbi:hypothetical protein HNO89_004039 [Sporosarcina luteola]|nr:hypothetical protein [Sporosarcina luteola]
MGLSKLSSTPPLWGLIIIAFILICQSTWMFWDARKRGHNAWLWGFLGLFTCPTYLIVYLVFARKIFKRKVSGSNS